MKALCVSQPWASLVCAGLEDIINRTWKPKENPERVLVVASGMQIPENYFEALPSCWAYRMDNHLAFGQIPQLAEMPNAAIIGYVDIVGFSDNENESIWSLPECWGWKISNAHTFKTPVPCDKVNEFLFDISEINDDNMPECKTIPVPERDGDKLLLPVSRQKFDGIVEGNKEIDINIYEENRSFFTEYLGKIWNPVKFKSIQVTDPFGRQMTFELDNVEIVLERDEHDYPLKIEKKDGWEYLYYVLFTLGNSI